MAAVPLGSLLAQMVEARDRYFPSQVRKRPDGSTYCECITDGCRVPAIDPQLHCAGHLTEAKRKQSEAIRAMDSESPTARRARRVREQVEATARRYASNDGRPDRWQDRVYMKRAQASVEAHMQQTTAKGKLDDVF